MNTTVNSTTDGVEVRFVDDIPAPQRGGRRGGTQKMIRFAEVLRNNPGKWAIYPFFHEKSHEAYRRSVMSAITHHGRRAPVPLRHGFVGAYRGDTAYVKWVGDTQEVSGDGLLR